jgi:ABC-type lipoprotein release transport system permease subunit
MIGTVAARADEVWKVYGADEARVVALRGVRAPDGEGITDLVLPWGGMSLYLALAALVGVLAAVLPSIRAARLNVLTAIAHE